MRCSLLSHPVIVSGPGPARPPRGARLRPGTAAPGMHRPQGVTTATGQLAQWPGPPPWLPFFPHPLLPGERMTPTRAPSLASPLSPSFSCSPFQLSLHSLHPTPLPFLPRPSHQSLISEVKKARSRGPHVTCWRAGALCSTMSTSVSAFTPVVGAVCWGRLSQTVQGKWHPLEL